MICARYRQVEGILNAAKSPIIGQREVKNTISLIMGTWPWMLPLIIAAYVPR